MWHVRKRKEMYTELWWIDMENRSHLNSLRCRWKDNIKHESKEIKKRGVNRIHVAQDKDSKRTAVNTV
jgi:hypothetical protein